MDTRTPIVGSLTVEERERFHGHKSLVVWLVGLSASGKSTLAGALERHFVERGYEAMVLDGDTFRGGVSSDLGFSGFDRTENIRRAAEVAALLSRAGLIVITAFISPMLADRQLARRIVERQSPGVRFVEVFVDASLQVCEARDPKGFYQRARSGSIQEFTGISAPFEAPRNADITIDSTRPPHEAMYQLANYLAPLLELASTTSAREACRT